MTAVSDTVIETRALTRTFRLGDIDVQALRGVNLTIKRGEFVAITGPSGSGKSTLMAILGCLDSPTGGEYLFEGTDIAHQSEPELATLRSEKLGFVFQNFNLLPRTSALENVELPLVYAARPTTSAERDSRGRALLQQLGLANRERNTPGQLSGGQQQRVALARALINGPPVLLADEPTGNLDTPTAHDIMDALASLNRDQGLTIVLVTHDPGIAAYADRIVMICDGRITSDERKHAPRASRAPDPPAVRPVQNQTAASSIALARMMVVAALQAIRRNIMRSALTMLGVFIGVAALIAMVDVGQGAEDQVSKQIESLGTNLVVVLPGAMTSSGVRAGSGSASTLTVEDARAIVREDRSVGQVGYLIRQMAQVRYGNQNWMTGVEGVSANFTAIDNWQIAFGRGISSADDNNAALVALIGQTVWRQLFGESTDPIGATIIVKNTPLKVVGVLTSRGQSALGTDQDDVVMIPFTTGERKVLGVAAPSQQLQQSNALYNAVPNPYEIQPRLTGLVNVIFVQALWPDLIKPAIDQVTHTLSRRHRIRPGELNDFSVRDLSQIANAAEGSSRAMSYLLAAVASVSLLVGGIGIMNILLVSVTERTREIGLRMAIGAQRVHVLLQFLAEAVLLSTMGGVAGILGGLIASFAIAWVANWPTPISWTAVAAGFLFSVAVGVFFGYYPARKAASLNPIEALRYE